MFTILSLVNACAPESEQSAATNAWAPGDGAILALYEERLAPPFSSGNAEVLRGFSSELCRLGYDVEVGPAGLDQGNAGAMCSGVAAIPERGADRELPLGCTHEGARSLGTITVRAARLASPENGVPVTLPAVCSASGRQLSLSGTTVLAIGGSVLSLLEGRLGAKGGDTTVLGIQAAGGSAPSAHATWVGVRPSSEHRDPYTAPLAPLHADPALRRVLLVVATSGDAARDAAPRAALSMSLAGCSQEASPTSTLCSTDEVSSIAEWLAVVKAPEWGDPTCATCAWPGPIDFIYPVDLSVLPTTTDSQLLTLGDIERLAASEAKVPLIGMDPTQTSRGYAWADGIHPHRYGQWLALAWDSERRAVQQGGHVVGNLEIRESEFRVCFDKLPATLPTMGTVCSSTGVCPSSTCAPHPGG